MASTSTISGRRICVISRYVGLPLAVEFGKLFLTTVFDINKERMTN